MTVLRRIGVLTSGGDAAGMNAAIRSVVRYAAAEGCEVLGIRQGFAGLIEGEAAVLDVRAAGHIMQQGGTVLGSSRAPEFETADGQERALEQLRRLEVEGLVIIGGNGTLQGAHVLAQRGFPVIGVASTIDNDVHGFDRTLGADTALNIILEAIDRLKTTASSHTRAFLVEVMGRNHGYLAVTAALAGGAEAVVIPEVEVDPAALAKELQLAYERGKPHAIVVVAEGASMDGQALAAYFKTHQEHGFDLRLTKLGHVQRGGIPSVADRLLGLRSGWEAARLLLAGETDRIVGLKDAKIVSLPLAEVAGKQKQLDPGLIELAMRLAI
jgi:6-phosphofructokinase 1